MILRLYNLLPARLACLLLIISFMHLRTYSQEKEKLVPNGTEGIIDTVDASTEKSKIQRRMILMEALLRFELV